MPSAKKKVSSADISAQITEIIENSLRNVTALCFGWLRE
jgi:hypothetical protein